MQIAVIAVIAKNMKKKKKKDREKFMAGLFLLFPFATTSFMTDPVMLQRGESGSGTMKRRECNCHSVP